MNMLLKILNRFSMWYAAVKKFTLAHKFLSIFIILAIVAGGWYAVRAFTSTSGETRYVLATVERGTVVSSINGTGQVSASNQVDLTSKTSGELVSLNAKVGQAVSAGALVGQIDATDASFELESAKLSYDKLINAAPADLANAKTDVANARTDARTALISASSGFSDTLKTTEDLLDGYLKLTPTRSDNEKTYITKAGQSNDKATTAATAFQKQYLAAESGSSDTGTEALTASAYQMALLVLDAAKSTKDAVSYVREHDTGNQTTADAAYTSANQAASDASSAVADLASARDAMTKANNALADLQSPDTLSVRNAQLTLRQKQQAYDDYFIRAPFGGVIAAVSAQKGDTLSSGATIATLITKQKIAEISLNEVDAAKIHTGQKATLTFDAIDGLTIAGEVVEVDLIGAVSQGVVSYKVKIAFGTDDDRVRSGMTVNADVITDTRQDVLVVPTSAVKTQSGQSYVLVFNPALSDTGGTQGIVSKTTPEQIPVEVGISSDTSVEILSGLTEGEQIVARSTSGTSAATSATTRTTGGGFGGGGIRL